MPEQVIYAARCVRCGAHLHRVGRPIEDGEAVSHDVRATDHNGLMASRRCPGAAVSVMGRTAAEVQALISTGEG